MRLSAVRSSLSLLLLLLHLAATSLCAEEIKTERRYLSGHGADDAVAWDFSVTSGRRAGEQTTIPVPSNWEQHGFGGYDYGQGSTQKSAEHGLYRLRFAVPETWKGRRIRLIFDGVMTDASVKVNGQSAGPMHSGGFNRFQYDVTTLVKPGAAADNLMEVDVSKISSVRDTEIAERNGDYWVFGGIFRPVWLEAAPVQSIEHTAINARADGTFTAEVTLAAVRDATRLEAQIFDTDGQPVGQPFFASIPGGGAGRVQVSTHLDSPRLWTAETPRLYALRLILRKGDEALHTTTTRFGFRTFEVRAGQGLFLNGQRILLKGVNRHSFRPETARALTRQDCYDDVRLIKSMNMNAVRMSHYAPDEAFLEACDELGLYVLDELSGWQHAHDTATGRLLVRALVERDVNHPSILFWDNGNEGGWNRELDGDFVLYDPQDRRVLHPWELHDDVDTKHYPNFPDITQRLNGSHLVMPTEFMHGLFDGGAGSGLEDYWKAIVASPVGAGGFIWVFADEGIARTDQGGRIDVYSTYAPDGIVGPHHEKKGSYYTVRDLWSPIQINDPYFSRHFDGYLYVTNSYDFTSLKDCRFHWKLVHFPGASETTIAPKILTEGDVAGPDIAPHSSGKIALTLPANFREANALLFTAMAPDGTEVWTWSWRTDGAMIMLESSPPTAPADRAPKIVTSSDEIQLVTGKISARFDATTGILHTFQSGDQLSALSNGPTLTFARPSAAGDTTWLTFASEDPATQIHRLAQPQPASTIEVELDYTKEIAYAGFKLEITPDGQKWKTLYDGSRRAGDGKSYNFPPQMVSAVRLTSPRRNDGQPIAVKTLRIGYSATRFPNASAAKTTITTGLNKNKDGVVFSAWLEARGGNGFDRFRWTLRGDGSLNLQYSYSLSGEFLYHGVTFDCPEEKMTKLRWLGQGPYRVWQNRLRGTSLGVHEITRNEIQPGESFNFPEFQGIFAGLRWARLDTTEGSLIVSSASSDVYLRVGTPRISHQNTTVEFPSGDLSFLHAIPAMGSKLITPEKSGPSGQPAKAFDRYVGSLVFSRTP